MMNEEEKNGYHGIGTPFWYASILAVPSLISFWMKAGTSYFSRLAQYSFQWAGHWVLFLRHRHRVS